MICPTCSRPVQAKDARPRATTWPFCSERCRLIDLGRWFGEEYRIPAEPAPPPGDEESDA